MARCTFVVPEQSSSSKYNFVFSPDRPVHAVSVNVLCRMAQKPNLGLSDTPDYQ